MEPTDVPLMLPLTEMAMSIFKDTLDELPTLRAHTMVRIGNEASITLGPISSRPNTAGLSPTAADAAGGNERAVISAGATTDRVTSANDAATSAAVPSTAQSSKATKQSARSAKGGGGTVGVAALDECASNALKEITQPEDANVGALMFGEGENDPWLAAAEVVAEDEAAFLEASAPSLEWAMRRGAFFAEKHSSAYLIEDILGEMIPAAEVPSPQPYTIDAIAMAKDHSDRLEATYSYKVPRGLHEVGRVSPRTYDADATRQTIGDHDPGGAVQAPEFVCSGTIRLNQEAAADSAAKSPKSPIPPSKKDSTIRRTRGATETKIAAAESTSYKKETKLKASLARPQLECSYTNIELRAGPRQTQELVLELWNTSAYSLRVKIAPSPWSPQLTVEPVCAHTYDPESPVAPGTSLLVRVRFAPIAARVADCVMQTKLSFGYTREVNEIRMTDQAFLTQQWSFLDIPVQCVTVLPQPQVMMAAEEEEEKGGNGRQINPTSSAPLLPTGNPLEIVFPPIFATTTTSIIRRVQNVGSRGMFRFTTTLPETFLVSQSACVLDHGEVFTLGVLFAPSFAGTFNEVLSITVHDAPHGTSTTTEDGLETLSRLACALSGESVVPSIVVESMGENEDGSSLAAAVVSFATLDAIEKRAAEDDRIGVDNSHDGHESNSEDAPQARQGGGFLVEPPLALFRDAAALHQSRMSLVLRNDGPLPLPYVWALQAVTTGNGPPAEFSVVPSIGIIAPHGGRVVAQVCMTPQTDDLVNGLLSLYLRDMPPPTAAAPRNNDDSAAALSSFSSGWLSRDRRVPCLEKPHTAVSLTDPFGLFQDPILQDDATTQIGSSAGVAHRCGCITQTPQTSENLFAAAIRVAADPKPLRVVVHPTRITSGVECLTNHQNERTFTLTNFSPRDVQFWLDPCTDANHPGVVLTDAHEIAAKHKYERQMRELFGKEWMPSSQRKREGCTLEFSPQCGVLRGNTTLEVHCKMTLERLGRHVMDIECFIDALGRDGSPSLTIVADAVGPTVHVSHALLDFGVIAVGDESEARFTVTNHNPVKVSFQVMDPLPCDPPRFVFLPERAALLPGKSIDVTAYRQGIIDACGGGGGAADEAQCFVEVVVDNGGTTAVECRATIQQPAAVVTPVTLSLGDMDCAIARESEVFLTNLSAIDIPFKLEIIRMPHTMSLLVPDTGVLFGGQYRASIKIKAQFNGPTADVAVVAIHSPKLPAPLLFEVTCAKVRPIAVALSTTMLRGDEPLVATSLSMETFVSELLWNLVTTEVLKDADVSPLFPHCPSVRIPFACIADDDPFCAIQTKLRVDNKSGCFSGVSVTGMAYVPLRSPFRAPASNKITDAARVATPPQQQQQGDRNDGASSVLSGTRRSGGSHQRHRGGAASSVGAATSTTVSQRIMKLKPDMPSFECKAIDGREATERERDTLREYAQSLLLDGRGCALQLQNATGPLKPHGAHDITATLIANLPGRYRETLRVECEGVPPVALMMDLVVQGRPVLADPTTSGLAAGPDGLKLTLPSVVAGMNRARRRVRIASRCPRDVEVRVVLQSITSSFQVDLTNKSSLSLVAPNDETSSSRVASVTPSTLLLPALGSSDITVEFFPNATMPGGEWKAQLMLSSRIAKTEYNDVFLMDEFYLHNSDRYPCDRAITALGLVQQSANNTSGDKIRAVPKLRVQQPLLDRPGVLKDNRVLMPNPSEMLVLELVRRQQLRATTPSMRFATSGNTSFCGAAPHSLPTPKASSPRPPAAVSDSDDEGDGSNDVRSIGNLEGVDKEALIAQDAERTELLDYVARRRDELYATVDDRFMTPTTMTVVGVIMPAKLQCDPPEALRFPLCKAGETASRAIRLTNPTRTPLDFRVKMDGPFSIDRIDFIPADAEEDILSEDDEDGRRTVARTRAGGTSITATRLGGPTPPSTKRTDPTSTLFHLRPRDSVDLTIELGGLSTSMVQHKHYIEGSLTVLFQGCPLTQVVPCLATVHTPSIVCDPEQTWFRPPVAIRDGKPQPKYPRSITLVNYSNCAATFSVRHVARIDAPGGARVGSAGGGETLQRLKKVQAVMMVSPMEQHGELHDDPSRFTIAPTSGVVPPSSKGGAPGRLVIQICFNEYSCLKYESRFRVDVDGGVGADFVVRGDSREVEV